MATYKTKRTIPDGVVNPFLTKLAVEEITKSDLITFDEEIEVNVISRHLLTKSLIDTEPFVKFFKLIELINKFEGSKAVYLITFLKIANKLDFERDLVEISRTDFEICTSLFYKTIKFLTEANLIKQYQYDMYWINLNFVFVGNRLSFIRRQYKVNYLKDV